jgi:class 3 adenylate cyclase
MDPDVPTTGQRMLAAIVFTDTVGFSQRVGADEEGTLILVKKDLDVMSKLCVRFEGKVVKSTGDGLMMLFPSAVQAVTCALEIQRILTEQHRADKNALMHRIGVHLGDVLVSDDDALGDGVNVAARLEQEAEPGGICMSQTVYEVVKGRIFLEAARIGDLKLKNIAEPISAYKVAGVAKARKHKRARNYGPALVACVILLLAAGAGGFWYLNNKANDSKKPDSVDQLGKDLAETATKFVDANLKNPEIQKGLQDAQKAEGATTGGTDNKTDDGVPAAPAAPIPETEEHVDDPASTAQPPITPVPTPTASTPFDEAWTLYAKKHDFAGMSRWVKDHQDQVPAGKTATELQARYDELASLNEWLAGAISHTTELNPVSIGWKGNPGTAWQRGDGKISIVLPRNRYVRLLSNLPPIMYASVARGLAAQAEAAQRDAIYKQIQDFIADANEHRGNQQDETAG